MAYLHQAKLVQIAEILIMFCLWAKLTQLLVVVKLSVRQIIVSLLLLHCQASHLCLMLGLHHLPRILQSRRDTKHTWSQSRQEHLVSWLPYLLPYLETSLPQSVWEECVTAPHSRDWICLLHAQYQLQTNPVTQPLVHYIDTAMPHVSYTLHCASCPIPPPLQKRNFPLL